MTEVRVLLIAPDPLARAALAALLAEVDHCLVVGRTDGDGDWDEWVALYQPDVILCDVGWQNSLTLPDLRELSIAVVALVADAQAVNEVWQAGVKGIVGRDVSAETITAALTAASQNLITFHPDTLPDTLTPPSATVAFTLPEPLTNREQDVLELLASGMTNRAIAHALSISDHTVKFHVNALLTKLNAQSRTEAAVKATRLGLLAL